MSHLIWRILQRPSKQQHYRPICIEDSLPVQFCFYLEPNCALLLRTFISRVESIRIRSPCGHGLKFKSAFPLYIVWRLYLHCLIHMGTFNTYIIKTRIQILKKPACFCFDRWLYIQNKRRRRQWLRKVPAIISNFLMNSLE